MLTPKDFLADVVDAGAILFALSPDAHLGCLPTGRALLLVLEPAKQVKVKGEVDEDGDPVIDWEPKKKLSKKLLTMMDDLSRSNVLVFEVMLPTWKATDEDDADAFRAYRFVPDDEPEDEDDAEQGEAEDEDWIEFEDAEELLEELVTIDVEEHQNQDSPMSASVSDDGKSLNVGNARHGLRLNEDGIALGGNRGAAMGMLSMKIDHPLYKTVVETLKSAVRK
jgi:hypothetical protein